MVTIIDILNKWQTGGIFDYVLPFLLIFSVVFGILESTKILGKQKGVHVIVALVIGLLSLRFGFVQQFFGELFPRLAVGIAVVLALLILTGLFIAKEETRYWLWGLAAISVIVLLIVLVGSFEGAGWLGYYGGYIGDYAELIVGAVLLIGVIIAVSASGGGGSTDREAGKATRQVFHE